MKEINYGSLYRSRYEHVAVYDINDKFKIVVFKVIIGFKVPTSNVQTYVKHIYITRGTYGYTVAPIDKNIELINCEFGHRTRYIRVLSKLIYQIISDVNTGKVELINIENNGR